MSGPLKEPPGVTAPAAGAATWDVEVYSAKIQKAWAALIKKAPVAAAREYQALRDAPFTVYPGRRFPRTVVAKAALRGLICTLPPERMRAVCVALGAAIDC